MPDISLRFHKDMLVVTPLLTAGLIDSTMDAEESIEFLNILDEDLVKDVYRRFKMAGAQCVVANTRKANRLQLKKLGLENALADVNRAGIRLAREVGFEHIIAVLEQAPLETLVEQADLLVSEEPDALLLVSEDEVFQTHTPAEAATPKSHLNKSKKEDELKNRTEDALKNETLDEHEALQVLREQTEIPLIAPTEGDILLSMGLSEADSLAWLKQRDAASTKPLMVCPQVQVKQAQSKSQQQRELTLAGDALVDFALQARASGAQFIGTAPGTPPVFTGALAAVLGGLDVVSQG